MDFLRKTIASVQSAAGLPTVGGSDPFVGRTIRINNLQLRVRSAIAEGGFGIVYHCTDESGAAYAVKRLLAHDAAGEKAVKREISFMRKATRQGSPFVLHLVAAASSPTGQMSASSPTEYLLLTELCPGGTVAALLQRMKKSGAAPLSPGQVARVFSQACQAVASLHRHSPTIIHRDIKLENFLIARDGNLRLCDFGSATVHRVNPAGMTYQQIVAAEEEIQAHTTPQNRTPEMLDLHQGHVVDERADVWALGCALYALCFGVHPFEDAAKLAILNARYPMPASAATVHAPFAPLIRAMLNVDPSARPPLSAVLETVATITAALPSGDLPLPDVSVTQAGAVGGGGGGGGGVSTLFSRAMGGASSLVDRAKTRSTKVIRSVAARDTRRHGGVAGDLDLTYITPRVLAMACPAEGLSSTYRNGVNELRAYLGGVHGLDHCLVVNLSERAYDPAKLGTHVRHFPCVPDMAPPLELLYGVCRTMHQWLLRDPGNVVAVHCTAGKGETGTAVAAYMMYCGLLQDSDSACRVFRAKRLVERKPCIKPSQQRYVSYIGRIADGRMPHKRPVALLSLVLGSVPLFNASGTGCRPYVEVYQGSALVKTTAEDQPDLHAYNAGEAVQIPLNLAVDGDVRLELFHSRSILGHSSPVRMCQLQLHSGYLVGSAIVFHRREIDGARMSKFDTGFNIRLNLKAMDGSAVPSASLWDAHEPTTRLQSEQACFPSPSEAMAFAADASFSDAGSVTGGSNTEDPNILMSDDEPEMLPDARMVTSPPPAKGRQDPFLLDLGVESKRAPSPPGTGADLLHFADPGADATAINSSEPQQANLLDMSFTMESHPVDAPAPGQHADLQDLLAPLTVDAGPAPAATPAAFGEQPPADECFADFGAHAAEPPAPARQPAQNNGSTAASNGLFNLMTGFGGPSAANIGQQQQEQQQPQAAMNGNLHIDSKAETGRRADGSMGTGLGPASGFPFTQPVSASALPTVNPPANPPAPGATSSTFAGYSSIPNTSPARPKPADPTNYMPSRPGGGQPSRARNGSASEAFDFLSAHKPGKDSGPVKMGDLVRESRAKTEDPIKLAVEEWAEGKEGNIRALIATLPQILWEGHGFQPISLGDIMEPSKVKKAFYKASLIIHPDKCQDKPYSDLAKEIFIKVSQAYEDFQESGKKSLF